VRVRVTLLTFLVAVAAASAVAQKPSRPDAERPLFSSESAELVVLPVAVTQGDGHFVVGLAKEQFTVFDNARPQPITLFTNQDSPVIVGLVLDDSSSMGPKLGEVIAAAGAFARSSNPEDELFAIAFNDVATDVMPGGPVYAHDLAGLTRALDRLRPQGRTALYDGTLVGLAREASSGSPARKVLIVISDGGDNASRATLDDVLAAARRQNVTIYTVGLFDVDDRDSDPGVLKKLARETGGERFLPRSPGPLLEAVTHIAREIRAGYTIGYVPPDRDGNYHRVRVTIDAPNARGLQIRTRPGYFAARNPTNGTR